MLTTNLSPSINIAVSINNTEQRILQALNALNDAIYNSIKDCWVSNNYTPQEYIDVLGTQAKDVFIFHGELSNFLLKYNNLIKSPFKLDENFFSNVKPYTVNQDGTITVNPPVPTTTVTPSVSGNVQ